jgi:hypothetical protein
MVELLVFGPQRDAAEHYLTYRVGGEYLRRLPDYRDVCSELSKWLYISNKGRRGGKGRSPVKSTVPRPEHPAGNGLAQFDQEPRKPAARYILRVIDALYDSPSQPGTPTWMRSEKFLSIPTDQVDVLFHLLLLLHFEERKTILDSKNIAKRAFYWARGQTQLLKRRYEQFREALTVAGRNC